MLHGLQHLLVFPWGGTRYHQDRFRLSHPGSQWWPIRQHSAPHSSMSSRAAPGAPRHAAEPGWVVLTHLQMGPPPAPTHCLHTRGPLGRGGNPEARCGGGTLVSAWGPGTEGRGPGLVLCPGLRRAVWTLTLLQALAGPAVTVPQWGEVP